jgi:hypothetical protein
VPDFATWLSGGSYIDAGSRAVAAWNRIQDRATDITLIRNGVKLAQQTVRVEVGAAGGEIRQDNSQLGTIGTQSVTVFGIQGHPTKPDTDIQRKDRFVLNGKEYDITGITLFPGEIQAFGEVRA